MNRHRSIGRVLAHVGLAALATLVNAAASNAQTNPLVGTWTLTAADVIKADGTRSEDYGPNPHGLAVFDADGHYMVEIYRVARARFASGDKQGGTFEEHKDAALGNSCHFGTYVLDAAKGTITFKIDSSTFTNWDGTTQVRTFTLEGDTLTWRVPKRPDGSIPVSSFRRATPRR